MSKLNTRRFDRFENLYSRATNAIGGPGNMEKLTYLVFGGLTTAINLAVFILINAIVRIKNSYLYANGVAWAVAVAFAFVTNKRYVFKSKSADLNGLLREIGSFTGVRIASLLYDYGFLLFAVELLNMNKNIAKILSNVVVVVMNYFFSKVFIFRNKQSAVSSVQKPDSTNVTESDTHAGENPERLTSINE